jgi:2-iminobutanoate/2-iminopropanoate deaminase
LSIGELSDRSRELFGSVRWTVDHKIDDGVEKRLHLPRPLRYGERLWQIVDGDFPGSAMVTITAFANPDAKIEIQGCAVIGSK